MYDRGKNKIHTWLRQLKKKYVLKKEIKKEVSVIHLYYSINIVNNIFYDIFSIRNFVLERENIRISY